MFGGLDENEPRAAVKVSTFVPLWTPCTSMSGTQAWQPDATSAAAVSDAPCLRVRHVCVRQCPNFPAKLRFKCAATNPIRVRPGWAPIRKGFHARSRLHFSATKLVCLDHRQHPTPRVTFVFHKAGMDPIYSASSPLLNRPTKPFWAGLAGTTSTSFFPTAI